MVASQPVVPSSSVTHTVTSYVPFRRYSWEPETVPPPAAWATVVGSGPSPSPQSMVAVWVSSNPASVKSAIADVPVSNSVTVNGSIASVTGATFNTV